MIGRWFIIILIVSFSCRNSGEQSLDNIIEGHEITVHIKNGLIYDGRGNPPEKGDILISGDEIIYVGKISDEINAPKVIDATGMVVSPGFIDPHAHGNPLRNDFNNFISQGVTSIALGQDGSSPFTSDFLTWAKKIDSAGTKVNIIPFMGHGTLRKKAGVPLDGTPNNAQLKWMNETLSNVLDQGVFGLTTGLEYIPGFYAEEVELISLAKTVGSKNALIMSHMRNEDNDKVDQSIMELLRQGQYTRVQASHLKVVYGKGSARAQQILGTLDSARKMGIDVYADTYPYTASYTGIGIVFPEWSKPPNNYEEVLQARRGELREYLIERISYRNGPEATLLGTSPWIGKTLEQIADSLGKHYADVLIDDIGPGGASGAYFVMDQELQETLFAGENVMVCSDGSPTMHHPRGYGSFAKIIEEYIVKKKLVSMEVGIWKMSGLQAESMGLTSRGVIEVGKKADIVIFDPQKVKANATYSDPHKEATGIEYVLLNGKVVREKGNVINKKYGKILLKKNE